MFKSSVNILFVVVTLALALVNVRSTRADLDTYRRASRGDSIRNDFFDFPGNGLVSSWDKKFLEIKAVRLSRHDIRNALGVDPAMSDEAIVRLLRRNPQNSLRFAKAIFRWADRLQMSNFDPENKIWENQSSFKRSAVCEAFSYFQNFETQAGLHGSDDLFLAVSVRQRDSLTIFEVRQSGYSAEFFRVMPSRSGEILRPNPIATERSYQRFPSHSKSEPVEPGRILSDGPSGPSKPFDRRDFQSVSAGCGKGFDSVTSYAR